MIYAGGGSCPCKGYYDYPAGTCVSVNDTLIHGIPSKKIILREGDIVSLDVVACLKGYCADATRTFGVGILKESVKQLVKVTRYAITRRFDVMLDGCRDVSYPIAWFCLFNAFIESFSTNIKNSLHVVLTSSN